MGCRGSKEEDADPVAEPTSPRMKVAGDRIVIKSSKTHTNALYEQPTQSHEPECTNIHVHPQTITILCVAAHPDGRLVTGADDSFLSIWGADGHLAAKRAEHTHYVFAVTCHPDGRIFTASGDSTVKIWSSEGLLVDTLTEHTRAVYSVTIAPDGRLLTGSDDCSIMVWSKTGQLQVVMTGHTRAVNDVAVHPDRRIL